MGTDTAPAAIAPIIACIIGNPFDIKMPNGDVLVEQGRRITARHIRALNKAKVDKLPEVEIWGDGEARREFMFASDLANFIWFAIDNFDTMPDLMNIGLGYDHTINEYYQAIAKVIGYKGKFVHDLSKPVGMKQKLVDITRLNNFGWEHKHSLEDGVNKTYDFFLENHC